MLTAFYYGVCVSAFFVGMYAPFKAISVLNKTLATKEKGKVNVRFLSPQDIYKRR